MQALINRAGQVIVTSATDLNDLTMSGARYYRKVSKLRLAVSETVFEK